jgi:lipoprotein-releasing system permease protein
MYKLLLCCRYLRTRWLAMVCIVSVMLGVATLIVVNSVMAGFSTKLKERLHGLLSDIVVEAADIDGFADPAGHMKRIRESPIGRHVQAMTPTLEVFALLQFPVRTPYREAVVTKTIKLIGVDPKSRTEVGGFSEYLYDVNFHDPYHPQLVHTAATFALTKDARDRFNSRRLPPQPEPAPDPAVANLDVPPVADWKDRPTRDITGAFVGHALAAFRDRTARLGEIKDVYMLAPGDVIDITTVSGVNADEGGRLRGVTDRVVLTGYFKSEMSEYDSNFVFVPLNYLQTIRGMPDRITSLQIKLNDYSHAIEVREELRKLFPSHTFMVQTWEDKQGALLAAISVERGILNVLLFMIVGVAGFGILAIFSMIVVEKTRDIGILKALGASNRGVMGIFLGYGLLLGIVGAGLGTIAGLTVTWNINWIEQQLTKWTGQQVFDRSIYYFDSRCCSASCRRCGRRCCTRCERCGSSNSQRTEDRGQNHRKDVCFFRFCPLSSFLWPLESFNVDRDQLAQILPPSQERGAGPPRAGLGGPRRRVPLRHRRVRVRQVHAAAPARHPRQARRRRDSPRRQANR